VSVFRTEAAQNLTFYHSEWQEVEVHLWKLSFRISDFPLFILHNTHLAGPFHRGKHRGYLAVFLKADMSWVLSRDFVSL